MLLVFQIEWILVLVENLKSYFIILGIYLQNELSVQR